MTSRRKPESDSDLICGPALPSSGAQGQQSLSRSVFNTQIGNTDMTAELLLKAALRELAEHDGQRRRETFRYLCAVVAATRALGNITVRGPTEAPSDLATWGAPPVMRERHSRFPD